MTCLAKSDMTLAVDDLSKLVSEQFLVVRSAAPLWMAALRWREQRSLKQIARELNADPEVDIYSTYTSKKSAGVFVAYSHVLERETRGIISFHEDRENASIQAEIIGLYGTVYSPLDEIQNKLDIQDTMPIHEIKTDDFYFNLCYDFILREEGQMHAVANVQKLLDSEDPKSGTNFAFMNFEADLRIKQVKIQTDYLRLHVTRRFQ